MPLLIDFKSGEKLIINGAVLENAGANSKILLHNMASILREKELLAEEDAQTPATRTYFALQNAYIFKEHRDDYLKQFQIHLDDYVKACPSARDIAAKIKKAVEAEKYYRGMKETRHLVLHEMELLQTLESEVQRWADQTAAMGEDFVEVDEPEQKNED